MKLSDSSRRTPQVYKDESATFIKINRNFHQDECAAFVKTSVFAHQECLP